VEHTPSPTLQVPKSTASPSPSPSEELPSTHAVIASESAAPVVGEMDSRSPEASPAPDASHPEATTAAHPEPEAVPIPSSKEGLSPEVPHVTGEPSSTGSHVFEPVAEPVERAVEKPQENGTYAKDSSPELKAFVLNDSTVSSSTTQPAAERTVGDNSASELTETPKVTSSHVAEPAGSEHKPEPTLATEANNASIPAVSVGDSQPAASVEAEPATPAHPIEGPTPQVVGDKVREDAPAVAGTTVEGGGPSAEVAPATSTLANETVAPPAPAAPVEAAPQPAQSAQAPVEEPANGSLPAVVEEKPKTNGHTVAPTAPVAAEAKKPEAQRPSTPVKSGKHTFPTSGSPSTSANNSPSSSKVGTAASRKKRTSFIAKVKQIFHHDKDKEKEKK
jgi:hypothetical protein